MLNAVTKGTGGDWGTDEDILLEETHPGKMLDKLMQKHNLALWQVADGATLSRPLVSAIKNMHRRVSPDTALKLGRYFGVDPQLWTAAQARWDLRERMRENEDSLSEIKPRE